MVINIEKIYLFEGIEVDLPRISSYKLASINSNTNANLPVGWSYNTSSNEII
jgi:hypothetical protein